MTHFRKPFKRSTRSNFLGQLLRPGLGLKRWLLLLLFGIVIGGVGIAFLVVSAYVNNRLPDFVYVLALRFLPDWVRAAGLLTLGVAATAYSLWQVNRRLVDAVLPAQRTPNPREMADLLVRRHRGSQGPRIVAIGGGTGMPKLLRGLRAYTDHLTAIVTVADDGGSSGRLRRQLGMLPPGDFRNNIAALSEAEALVTRLFQYRFASGDAAHLGDGANELAGHSFGNLFITTMAAITGSFEAGIAESSRVLAVRGRVLPSTLEQITLCAEISGERENERGERETRWLTVRGESQIPEAEGRIERVFLEPDVPRAYPEAIQAILRADLIVASPGSFFTSVMPNLLVPDIQRAICAAPVPRVYVCNVLTQRGETDGFSVSDHVAQLRRHAGEAFPNVLANHARAELPLGHGEWVALPSERGEAPPADYRLFTGDLIRDDQPWQHDAEKLAARLMAVYEELRA